MRQEPNHDMDYWRRRALEAERARFVNRFDQPRLDRPEGRQVVGEITEDELAAALPAWDEAR